MYEKDVLPATILIHPMKEEDVDGVAVICSTYLGAPLPEYCRKKASKGYYKE